MRAEGLSGTDQGGKHRLQRVVAPAQGVVFRVADFRRVPAVIERIVPGDFRGQTRKLRCGVLGGVAGNILAVDAHDGPLAIRLSAAARASSVIRAPASIRAISSRRSSAWSSSTTVVISGPARRRAARLWTRQWAAPSAATWGEWVIASTWTARPSRRSRSPTAAEVAPPMPESTSSKTSVGTESVARSNHLQRKHEPGKLATRGDAR